MHVLIEENEARKTFNNIYVVTYVDETKTLWCINKKCKVIQYNLQENTVITIYANKPKQPTDKPTE